MLHKTLWVERGVNRGHQAAAATFYFILFLFHFCVNSCLLSFENFEENNQIIDSRTFFQGMQIILVFSLS